MQNTPYSRPRVWQTLVDRPSILSRRETILLGHQSFPSRLGGATHIFVTGNRLFQSGSKISRIRSCCIGALGKSRAFVRHSVQRLLPSRWPTAPAPEHEPHLLEAGYGEFLSEQLTGQYHLL
jgi:hypothetical protein